MTLPRGSAWRWLAAVVAVSVSAGATAMYALAGHEAGPVASYTGCLKPNGDLVKLAAGDAPRDTCAAAQVAIHLSGGDITDVATAPDGGLQGGTASGAASLGLASGFRLPQSCANGQVAKASAAGAWACGDDQGATGPQLPQGCGHNVSVRWDDLLGRWLCGVRRSTTGG